MFGQNASRLVSVPENQPAVSNNNEIPDERMAVESATNTTTQPIRKHVLDELHRRLWPYNFHSIPNENHKRFLYSLNLRKEADRITSFTVNWPHVTQGVAFVRELASSGFYYLGNMDRTQCFSCGGVLLNWEPEAQVNRAHREEFPNCKMVHGTEVTNIPITGTNDDVFTQEIMTTERTTNTTTYPRRRHVLDELRIRLGPIHFPSIPDENHERFLYSLDLRKETNRITSFNSNWPHVAQGAPSIQEMASSGFYYLGNLDRTQCFSCGGVLLNWDPGDRVDSQHRTHFPNCKMVQGNEHTNIPIATIQQSTTSATVQSLSHNVAAQSQLEDENDLQIRVSMQCS